MNDENGGEGDHAGLKSDEQENGSGNEREKENGSGNEREKENESGNGNEVANNEMEKENGSGDGDDGGDDLLRPFGRQVEIEKTEEGEEIEKHHTD